MANGTIAFDTLSTSGQISGTAKSVDTDYLLYGSSKYWSNWDGTDVSNIRDSFNLTTLTDNGTGDYSQTFTNSMLNNGYTHTTACGSGSGHIALLYSLGQNLSYRCRTYIIEEAGSTPSVTDDALVVSTVVGNLA